MISPQTTTDTRVVYGARCTWWDTIDAASSVKTPSGNSLPCCPNCQSPLYEVESLQKWAAGVKQHAKVEPRYVEFIDWSRGKCYPDFDHAKAAFEEATKV